MKETEDVVHMSLDFLPLKSYTNITEGNALEINWKNVVSNDKLNYIMGNPPFVGARLMEQGSDQKKEIQTIFGNIKDVQDLDYVTCWYKLASQYIQNTKIPKYKFVLFQPTRFAKVPRSRFYGMYCFMTTMFISILHIKHSNGIVNLHRR